MNKKSGLRKITHLIRHYNFLNNWKKVVTEKLGILIFETKGVPIEEMRGLSIFHEEVPIILLNGKDSVNGRIFSLFHELTHLLLGESAICDNDENIKEEIFCNAVAGEFLVPEDDLNNNINENISLSLDLLINLADLYGVSAQVVLRRLYDTNNISKKDFISQFENFDEYSSLKCDGGNYFNNMLKYNSESYCARVLEAYENGIITSGEFSRFTSLKKRFIPELQKRVYGVEQ